FSRQLRLLLCQTTRGAPCAIRRTPGSRRATAVRPGSTSCCGGRDVRFRPILQSRLRLLRFRRATFFDDTVRDIPYALRAIKRAPLVAFTIVSTVGLGLGLVTVAFT